MKLTRQQIIEELAESVFDSIRQDPDELWFIVKEGFKGLNEYPDEELLSLYKDYMTDILEEGEEVLLVAQT
jgi:hypothetical protein